MPSGDSWTYSPPACRRASRSTPSFGPDQRHDHRLGERLLGLGHGERRPGRQRQPELHLERVHPVGDESRDAEQRGRRQRCRCRFRPAVCPAAIRGPTQPPACRRACRSTPSSGLISGTITGSANAYSVSVTASDGQGASASQSFTWNVSTLSVTNPGTQNSAVGDSGLAADSVRRSAQRRYVDLRRHRLAVGPVHQHQLGPDRRHDHWLGEYLLGLGHGQRRPGRQRQPELHLERVHPVGD